MNISFGSFNDSHHLSHNSSTPISDDFELKRILRGFSPRSLEDLITNVG